MGFGVNKTNSGLISEINEELNANYNVVNPDAQKGAKLPSLSEHYYIIRIDYYDLYQNYHSLFFKYEHMHGLGFWKKSKSNESEVLDLIKFTTYPQKFTEFWDYIRKEPKYRFPS